MKRLICLMLALCIAGFATGVLADETAPLVSTELNPIAEALKSAALASTPMNDPAGEDAQYEDGTLLRYEFAALYCDRTEMTEDTEIQAISIIAGEEPVIRGTGIDSNLETVLAGYPNSNPELAGTPQRALLYLVEGDDGSYQYGTITRDGQRIREIIYGSAEKEGNGYRMASIRYTLQSGMVSEIRITGLGKKGITETGIRDELYEELNTLKDETAYKKVPTSEIGTDLDPFQASDLVFSGINLETATPNDFPGMPDVTAPESWDENQWVIRVNGDGYAAIYTCNSDGSNPQLMRFEITGEDFEGPRGIRIGDPLYEDMNRFRHGENQTDGVTELLYGTNGTAPYGFADYAGNDGMTLKYVAKTSDGRTIEMLLSYEYASLSSVDLTILDEQ